jgi:hypothetical protein
MSALNMWLAARFPRMRTFAVRRVHVAFALQLQSPPYPNLRQRLVWKFLSPSGAPLMACDFDVLLKVLFLRMVTPAANSSS